MSGIPDYKKLTSDVSSNLNSLRQDLSPVMKAFGELSKAASAPGALDEKTKEFVALGIAIAARCDACIGFHVRTLIRLGARKAEIEEVLGMAVYMGGGPALMYAANAMAAYEQFTQT